MKRSESEIISEFLFAVRKKYITADDEQLKPGQDRGQAAIALNRVCFAFDLILNGVSPEEALRITPGDRRDPYNVELAEMIFYERVIGTKWAVIELRANEWLASRGRPPLSESGLRRIYRESGRGRADELSMQAALQDEDGEWLTANNREWMAKLGID